MSLRQAKDDPPPPTPDEESQSLHKTADTPEQSSALASNNTPLSAFDRMTTATNTSNPVLLAKLVLTKFVLLLTNESEEDPNTRLGFTLALVKDIVLGITFGLLTISFAIVLDHRNIIHIESAHNLRNAAYSSLSDPETLQYVEVETDMKFLSLDEYESIQGEITEADAKIDSIQEKLTKYDTELETATKNLEELTKEKDDLLQNSPALKILDDFCGECSWSGRTNCNVRVQYLVDTYNNAVAPMRLDLMKTGLCKKE